MTPNENVVVLPVLPLKNTVLFPHLFMPLAVGRPNSMAAIEAVLATEEKSFVVAAQRDADNEQPGLDDLYPVGTRAVIKKMARGEGVIELIVQGMERVSILKAEQTEPFLRARVQPMPEPTDTGTETEATYRATIDLAGRVLELAQVQVPVNIQQLVAQTQDPLRFAYMIGSMLSLDVPREQRFWKRRRGPRRCGCCTATSTTRCRCWSCASRSARKPSRR